MVDATTRIQELTSLNDTQLQKLVSIISNAFSGGVTQSFYGLLGGNMSLQEELFSAIIRATFLEGKIYVVESGGDVVTVCLVFREPASLFGSDAQRALGFTDVYKKLDPRTQAWWDTEYSAQTAEFEKSIITREEWDVMWHFSLIATDPQHQSKGYTSYFMKTFFEEVNRKGEIFGLSTGAEVNVSKYASMGFRERGRIVVKTPVNEFPCIWLTKP